MSAPAVVTIDMGYGHLRAAQAIADALGTAAMQIDREPLATEAEGPRWARTRSFYEVTSRLSQLPVVGGPFKNLLDSITSIPHLHPYRDLSAPHAGVKMLDRAIQRGLGEGLVRYLRNTGSPLITTFYAPAVIADRAGLPNVFCVITDTDLNRVWVPMDAKRSRIRYLAPTQRARRRLEAYGVHPEHIHFTGFPLPDSLIGGPSLATAKANLAARLVRLDPEGTFLRDERDELEHFLGALPLQASGPPRLTFAVGGAGAQADIARKFLPSLRGALASGRLRLTLVAGVRQHVAEWFDAWLAEHGMSDLKGGPVDILLERDFPSYYTRFNALLAETDILWSKPSEITFYGALGIPLVLAPPVGVHEKYNRRWAIENGAGFKMRDPSFAGEWLNELLAEGTLAAAAWHGFMRMPKFGTQRIAELLRSASEN
ncbi:MAG: hypothetical protein H7Z43_00560 [Clostridia bacterium]|nr:hypothetical protein [Deltaproteobacteria bacterium]